MTQPQQDWEPVIWQKPKQLTQIKPNKKTSNLDSDEPLAPEKSTLDLRLRIIKGRNIKELTQNNELFLFSIQ